MVADLQEKTNRYEGMLVNAFDKAVQAAPDETHLGAAVADYLEMTEPYLDDGRHFKANDDWVNALASFSYGYNWLDASVRMGLFDISNNSHPLTV